LEFEIYIVGASPRKITPIKGYTTPEKITPIKGYTTPEKITPIKGMKDE